MLYIVTPINSSLLFLYLLTCNLIKWLLVQELLTWIHILHLLLILLLSYCFMFIIMNPITIIFIISYIFFWVFVDARHFAYCFLVLVSEAPLWLQCRGSFIMWFHAVGAQ